MLARSSDMKGSKILRYSGLMKVIPHIGNKPSKPYQKPRFRDISRYSGVLGIPYSIPPFRGSKCHGHHHVTAFPRHGNSNITTTPLLQPTNYSNRNCTIKSVSYTTFDKKNNYGRRLYSTFTFSKYSKNDENHDIPKTTIDSDDKSNFKDSDEKSRNNMYNKDNNRPTQEEEKEEEEEEESVDDKKFSNFPFYKYDPDTLEDDSIGIFFNIDDIKFHFGDLGNNKTSIATKKLAYPIKIVGTRKPVEELLSPIPGSCKPTNMVKKERGFFRRNFHSTLFWSPDRNFSYIIKDVMDPGLYLTFQDSKGKIVGPFRYNSNINLRGIKWDLSYRLTFGNIRKYENVTFDEFPNSFDIEEGRDWCYPFCYWAGYSSSTFKLKDLPIKVTYKGINFLWGYGFHLLKDGKFEVDPNISDRGLGKTKENLALTALLLFQSISIGKVLYDLSYMVLDYLWSYLLQ